MEIPKYLLSLDDLPMVVQADDRVHPVFMTTADVARLFDVQETSVLAWLRRAKIGVIRPFGGTHYYVEVIKIAQWIRENSTALGDTE